MDRDKKEILKNIKNFKKLSPSQKICYLEKERQILKFFRQLKFERDASRKVI